VHFDIFMEPKNITDSQQESTTDLTEEWYAQWPRVFSRLVYPPQPTCHSSYVGGPFAPPSSAP
jgi:hypothetical protein